MQVLITGANGFIGKAAAMACVAEGWRVLAAPLRLPDHAEQLSHLIAIHPPDACIHCAGPASVRDSIIDPQRDFVNSVSATFALLDALRHTVPRCRTVLLSSAAVYGNPQTLPIREDSPLSPISPYGFHKRMVEQLAAEFHQVYGLPVTLARIFSAYGANLKRQVVWDIRQKAHTTPSDQPIRLSGSGNETRDFIHVDDVARALLALLKHAPMQAEAFNVASGCSVSIRTLAHNIAPQHRIEFDGLVRPGDPLYWQADISRLAALGFACQIGLDQGLQTYD